MSENITSTVDELSYRWVYTEKEVNVPDGWTFMHINWFHRELNHDEIVDILKKYTTGKFILYENGAAFQLTKDAVSFKLRMR